MVQVEFVPSQRRTCSLGTIEIREWHQLLVASLKAVWVRELSYWWKKDVPSPKSAGEYPTASEGAPVAGTREAWAAVDVSPTQATSCTAPTSGYIEHEYAWRQQTVQGTIEQHLPEFCWSSHRRLSCTTAGCHRQIAIQDLRSCSKLGIPMHSQN